MFICDEKFSDEICLSFQSVPQFRILSSITVVQSEENKNENIACKHASDELPNPNLRSNSWGLILTAILSTTWSVVDCKQMWLVWVPPLTSA